MRLVVGELWARGNALVVRGMRIRIARIRCWGRTEGVEAQMMKVGRQRRVGHPEKKEQWLEVAEIAASEGQLELRVVLVRGLQALG